MGIFSVGLDHYNFSNISFCDTKLSQNRTLSDGKPKWVKDLNHSYISKLMRKYLRTAPNETVTKWFHCFTLDPDRTILSGTCRKLGGHNEAYKGEIKIWCTGKASLRLKVIGSKLRKWGTKSCLSDVIEIHGADRDKTALSQNEAQSIFISHNAANIHNAHTIFLLVLNLIEQVSALGHDNIELAASKQMQGHTGTDSC